MKICSLFFLSILVLFFCCWSDASVDTTPYSIDDYIFRDVSGVHVDPDCPRIDVELTWVNQLDSGVYATPTVIASGILIPTFDGTLEMLDYNGHRMPGWPISLPNMKFHSGALVYDFNGDGSLDFIWVSLDGDIVIINGEPTLAGKPVPGIANQMRIPKLRVNRNWYMGLKDEYVSRAVPAQPRPIPHASKADNATTIDGSSILKHAQDVPTLKDAIDSLADLLTEEGRSSLQEFLSDSETHPQQPIAGIQNESTYSQDEARYYPDDPMHIYLDSHILATPVLVDIDGDNFPELICAVSYYYDTEEFLNHPANYRTLPDDIQLQNYVAGGLLAFDLEQGHVKWSLELDHSTTGAIKKAYIHGSPTVIDLDGDGELEVLIGTSLGMIYAVKANNGELLPGFPLDADEIQGQIGVADLNDDGQMEMVICDKGGNVICFSSIGEEIWTRNITGFSVTGPSIADVNGDGLLDIVFGALDGTIWALEGETGIPLDHFPIKTGAKILSPVTLVGLHTTNCETDVACIGLHIVVSSFDGNVYIVDGVTGCVEKLDISERSYSMVLIDSFHAPNRQTHVDMLVSTMNGNVFAFSTQVPFNPLKRSLQGCAVNGFSSPEGYYGAFISPRTKLKTRVHGHGFAVQFEIQDHRKAQVDRIYNVQLSAGGYKPLFSGQYSKPGLYTEWVSCPRTPEAMNVILRMVDEHAFSFTDSFVVSCNNGVLRLLKYFILMPFISLVLVLVLLRNPFRHLSNHT